MNVAMLLSCGSFEGFFGGVQGQSRESYISNYRNDWAWYHGIGLVDNGIRPIIYIPSLYEYGKYETEAGVSVRFIKIDRWYRPLEKKFIKQLSRQTKITSYIDERLNTIAFMKDFHRSLFEDQVDLIYIQEYWSGRFDHVVHRVSIPVTAVNQGGLPDKTLKWFKKSAFKKAAACYGQTRGQCQEIEAMGGISYLQPNGCDLSNFTPNPKIVRQKTLLSVARLTNKQKRTSDLIKALAILPEEWSLDIVGTGPDRLKFENLCSNLKISHRVRFHGFVSRGAVRDFLWRCGVYVMPSSNEAVAMAALEAMGCGAPVVLSRIKTFEELVDDGINGRLVPVGDVSALASAIIDAWERREAMGKAAVATVQSKYNTEVLYKNLAHTMRKAAMEYKPDLN